MKYNPDLHKRRSLRLKSYDYSSEGCYFVTICCADRLPLFGMVDDQKMYLNEYGQIAYDQWFNTLNQRTGIELDEFIVMPNHIHGIITLTEDFHQAHQIRHRGVCDTPLRSPTYTLGSVIRGYKGAVTSRLKDALGEKIWQRNYYEHIIRNEKSYLKIAEYISNNPITWKNDRFFIKNRG